MSVCETAENSLEYNSIGFTGMELARQSSFIKQWDQFAAKVMEGTLKQPETVDIRLIDNSNKVSNKLSNRDNVDPYLENQVDIKFQKNVSPEESADKKIETKKSIVKPISCPRSLNTHVRACKGKNKHFTSGKLFA